MMLQYRALTLAAIVLSMGLTLSGAVNAAPVYQSGHGDVGAEYDPGEDPNEFHLHLHLHAGTVVDGIPLADDVEFAGAEAVIEVPDSANIGRTSGMLGGSFESFDFTGAGFNFLGTTVGSDLWVLMFDSADASFYGGPFLGLAAEEGFTPSQWTGAIAYQMTGFAGPGQFSLFTAAGSRRWDTQDGSFANDSVNIGAGGHSHFYWAFTAPGTYEVTVTATGTHNTAGLVTGSDTFRFHVVPEPASGALMAVGVLGLGGVAFRRARRRIRAAA